MIEHIEFWFAELVAELLMMVVLGGAAVAGFGIYRTYKYFTRKPKP